jgi:hypothetical protein
MTEAAKPMTGSRTTIWLGEDVRTMSAVSDSHEHPMEVVAGRIMHDPGGLLDPSRARA